VAVAQVAVAAALVIVAVGVSAVWRLGLERELAVAALRAAVQLAIVGLVVAAVFERLGLAAAFVAVMLCAATITAGSRLRGVPGARPRAGAAIGLAAAAGVIPLFVTGAFDLTPRELIPVAGILIGGAMAATTLAGRRLMEDLRDGLPEIEARLLLGAPARTALAPAVRRAVTTAMVPVIDQTRNVGLVTLPGTFVGLVLGGASPAEAARIQLVVLLSLLGVEILAALLTAALVVGASVREGERVVPPPG
jgi:putative ABC transport system permease protein